MQYKIIGKKIGKYLAMPLLAASMLKTGCDWNEDRQKGQVISTVSYFEEPKSQEKLGSKMILYNEKADADAQNGIDYTNLPNRGRVLKFNRNKGIDVDMPFNRSSGLFWVPEGCVKRGYEKNIIEKESRFLNFLDFFGFDE